MGLVCLQDNLQDSPCWGVLGLAHSACRQRACQRNSVRLHGRYEAGVSCMQRSLRLAAAAAVSTPGSAQVPQLLTPC